MAPASSLDERPSQLDALDHISRLPDHCFLTTSEAAIFLRSSVSALKSLRSKGEGLVYRQQDAKGGSGVNQKCLYEKADLLAGQLAAKVASAAQAAVREGQFFSTLVDLVQTGAFSVAPYDQMVGMGEAAAISIVIDRRGQYDIEWLTVIEAAAKRWLNVSEHQAFADQVSNVLLREIQHIAAGVESTELSCALFEKSGVQP